MTYAQFLVQFVVPPIIGLAVWIGYRWGVDRRLILALGGTSAIAVAYTGPWDHLILTQGVWSYPQGRILGPTIGLVPVEEYGFFVLQVMLTGLLTYAFLRRQR